MIDTSGAGSATPLFALGTGFTGGLAFDSANGLLYAIANDNGGKSTLDSITLGGTVTPLALTLGQGFTGGLAYSSGSGRFYAVSSDSFGNSSLSDFTLASSSATSLFGVPSGTNNAALTVGPAGGVVATPEPSTLPMLLVGAALVVIGSLRKSLRGAAVVAAAIVVSAGSSFAQYSQPVHDVDNPARQPAKFFLNVTELANGTPPITFAFVPFGKRLVIEHIQMSCDHDASFVGMREFDPNVNVIGGIKFPPSPPPPSSVFWIDHDLRYYADPGSELTLDIPNLGPIIYNCSFLATGYYVNLP
jgi:hypothetical protein